MKITVAGREFATRAEAKVEFRRLLTLPAGTIFYPGSSEFAFLLAFLETHPQAKAKIGPGIAFFRIIPNVVGNGNGWEVARTDGVSVGFSYRECLRTRPKGNHASDFARTCRIEVGSQIDAFRSASFSTGLAPCASCEIAIAPSACEIDHKPPKTFKALVAEFTASNGIDPRTVLYEDGGPACPDKFADRALAIAWQEYHYQNAMLQVLCKPCHANATRVRRESEAD